MSGDHVDGGRPLPPPPPSDVYAAPTGGRPYAAVAPGAYYGHRGPSRGTKPLGGLSVAASVLLGGMTVLAGVVAAALFAEARAIDRFLDGRVSVDDVDEAAARVGLAVILYGLGVIATGVVFIIWQYRHTTNAEAIGGRPGLGPGWAIGGWFIPVANLVLPPIQIFQSSRASDETLPAGAPGPHGRGHPAVVVWAVLLALGSVLSVVGPGVAAEDGLQQGDIDANNLVGVAYVALALAAVAGIVMVRVLTRRQQDRLSAIAGPGQPVGQVMPGTPPFPPQPPPPGTSPPPFPPPAAPGDGPPPPDAPGDAPPLTPPAQGDTPPPQPGTGWPSSP